MEEVHYRFAALSECGRYRYGLCRRWGQNNGSLNLPFIMLNPSTADGTEDDPTIRRCMGFARREGYPGILVCNLFAYRATRPSDLMKAVNPVGPRNDSHLSKLFDVSAHTGLPIICAWGVHGVYRGRNRVVLDMAREAGAKMAVLGLTKDGHPKHPLYLPGDSPITYL